MLFMLSLLISPNAQAQSAVKQPKQPVYGLGAILEDNTSYSRRMATKASSPFLLTGRNFPKRVDFCNELPLPGHQGGTNSCVAWASAYAARSYYEKQRQRWPLRTEDNSNNVLEHVFSPSYVYNQLVRCTPNLGFGLSCGGIGIHQALTLMQSEGVATWKSFPFSPDPTYASVQPDSLAKSEAGRFKIDQFGVVFLDPQLDSIRTVLSSREPVIFAIPVDQNFMSYTGGTYDSPLTGISGYHAMIMCGYDDANQTIRIMNSYGRDWGENGYMNMSYRSLISYASVAQMAQFYRIHQNITSPETPCPHVISDDSPVLIGDVNGDKKADIVAIGAAGMPNAGGVYVGLSTGGFFDFWAGSTSPGKISNRSPVLLGDVNGDGKSDLIAIGAEGMANAGVVYVGLSDGKGFSYWSWRSPSSVISSGSVVRAADVNGDGKTDLIAIGAPGSGNRGTVYVAFSNGEGFNFWNWTSAPGIISNDSPVLLGDVNGDRKSDLVAIGAPGQPNEGVVYIGLSQGNGFSPWSWNSKSLVVSNHSPVLIGDVNGDGRADLIAVGPPSLGNQGVVYVALSNGDGFKFWSWSSSQSVISNKSPLLLGDITGDGRSDLIAIGAQGQGNAGVVYAGHAGAGPMGFAFWSTCK